MGETPGNIFSVMGGLRVAVIPHTQIAGIVAGCTIHRLVAGMFRCAWPAGRVMAIYTSHGQAVRAMAIHTIHGGMDLCLLMLFDNFESMLPFMTVCA